MFILQNISYIHSDGELLFDHINLSAAPTEKIAVIAHNGAGKSTLLKIIAGQILPHTGTVTTSSKPYYIPQIVGRFDRLSVAQALGIADRLSALSEILSGNVTDKNLATLNDDWTVKERCREALSCWELDGLDLNVRMETLSGGQKTKVFLAGIKIHNPGIVLLDEPANHLDSTGRNLLYRFVGETSATVVTVSHDRALLNRLEKMYELNRHGMKVYGGNYDFYKAQKTLEQEALAGNLEERQKALRKAKDMEREALERQRKRESQGKKNAVKGGLPLILAGGRKNKAENNAAHLKGVHAGKINAIAQELTGLRKEIPDRDKIRFEFDNSALHRGKILVSADAVNFAYGKQALWSQPLSFQILSGERIEIKGRNGSGKTTLLRLILGDIEPNCGAIFRADSKTLYIDQEYSLLHPELTVYEQAQAFNDAALQEHEIRIRLARFLFSQEFWDKPVATLSGGERMRLLLCCMTITGRSPDMIVLDEPTNNIDISNREILADAVNDYRGTLIVVSHDACFPEQINIERQMDLDIMQYLSPY
jgi:ATPase subunit of ABC transporter with duplicated ATPase domains